MANRAISPTSIERPADGSALAAAAVSATLNAPADKWKVPNNGRTYLRFTNDHATQTGTISIETPATVDGLAVADRTHTIAAGRTAELIGPFPVDTYGDELTITATGQGTLKVAALQF